MCMLLFSLWPYNRNKTLISLQESGKLRRLLLVPKKDRTADHVKVVNRVPLNYLYDKRN